ncbi:uncharacterized protein SPAPADRAFT_57819 [Spathaspora passalidarum NRRL Y-27907]|uniref:Protein LOT5 n=1 Tax=Spathaspora passalidarum (strain NRRL Y-27907 / 11-Y1) TaxID=619300 RepID=G3AEJ4_SPAPN|nr:uncharacterized protein SPAPADRAFT_57819 [Spathaspora passalidarum NRRL Y-27907]EGW34756.1 hypothetical protein SPAPADRAFT_57819 [Spathaspora passalidarum NRRL Y-27907]
MAPTPRIVFEQPNIENTIPFTLYQSSSPEKFSFEDSDKFVIHGGGPFYSITGIEDAETETCLELQGVDCNDVSLFVLNTSFIIWFNANERGLELPYQSIVLHAINEGKDDYMLYLQVVSSEVMYSVNNNSPGFVSYVNLNITPTSPTNPHRMHDVNKLFSQVKDFGIVSIYEALSKCSSLHYDTESEEEEVGGAGADRAFFGASLEQPQQQEPVLEIPTSWISHNGVGGYGDDLDDIVIEDEAIDAGMHVDVGYGPIAGSIRKREDDLEGVVKSRRLI